MNGSRRTAVVATAGHVDHGKSTLVRALTGIEPDRWESEQRRGLTIDLGFAWMSTGDWDVSFVDVPGHERFLSNALTGLCPAPVVCFVVAAHEGWKPQSSDHRDVVAALGISAGLIVLTHADQASREQISTTMTQVRRELANTGLRDAPIVVASAVTGQGMEALRQELVAILDEAASPPGSGAAEANPVRLWIDRSFTMRGAGAVVTATLTGGVVSRGDELILNAAAHSSPQPVSVREVQSRGATQSLVTAVDRLALNLRGVQSTTICRGDVLCTPAAWKAVSEFDARIVWGEQVWGTSYADTRVHVGTAAVSATLRRLGSDTLRIRVDRPLPLQAGDRIALGSPHRRGVAAGAVVLDINPSALRRRGDAARHGDELVAVHDGDREGTARYLASLGVVNDRRLGELGLQVSEGHLPGFRRLGRWWVSDERWSEWVAGLAQIVSATYTQDALTAGVSQGAVVSELDLPDPTVLALVAREAGYRLDRGRVVDPRRVDQLGAAAAGVARVVELLGRDPFRAPEADELTRWGLGRRELAAAERAGRLLVVTSGVVLTPDAPERALEILAELDEPFTVSQARAALGTTRRVAVPLLEWLDQRGWTRRIDGTRRKVVRPVG